MIGGLASLALKLAPYAVASAVVVGVYHNLPIVGPGARIERLAADRDGWRDKAEGWIAYGRAEKAAFAASERLRRQEASRAIGALNDERQACDVRVARARASATAIRNIVTRETPHDPNGCPADPGLVDPDELRDAIDPARRR